METLVDRMHMLMGRFDDNVNVLSGFQDDVVIPLFHTQDTTPIESRQQQVLGIDHMEDIVTIDPAESHRDEVPRLQVISTTGNSDEDAVEEDVVEEDVVEEDVVEEDAVEEEDESNLEEEGELTQNNPIDHVMTVDSYGKLRFVGGTSTMVIIEALKSLTPTTSTSSTHDSCTTGTLDSAIELPFFKRGQIWPRLSYLPQADDLPRPPRYISDMLINLYFEQLHFTLPVIYKPQFMARYRLLLANTQQGTNVDAAFLAVFFAVCACASGLFPRQSGNLTAFPGLDFYECAMVLLQASTGEGTIEQVQTLALISMCSAGWNKLAQSWKFAKQAVSAAQDLGLHRSPARGAGQLLKEELCRRIWWSVYGLDRILSITLGRPMGIDDNDCDCEMPLDIDDDSLESYCASISTSDIASLRTATQPFFPPSRITGFIAFAHLCKIAGRIVRAMSALEMKGPRSATELRRTVETLESELTNWLQNVPDAIKFSVNSADEISGPGAPHLTIPLIPDPNHVHNTLEHPSYQKCINAARSCIRVAELIRERVPPSHHLALCTHNLTVSGVLLLRTMTSSPSLTLNPSSDVTADVNACIRYITSLQSVWQGSERSRMILEELWEYTRSKSGGAIFNPMMPAY
ncbi:hypothetical protein BP6252_10799 [Coleophoma cylindrospora]|uniref:Xylanolytic transcriptional activator regulatory domain-containing protein n=1 Tax=Coleophoma cylindrospora TaxID=1849047 RepID=A0A3D8QP77_9HELO|nr:hypothetical protein BP6252_10799 [Coleophoma cylindrospora]